MNYGLPVFVFAQNGVDIELFNFHLKRALIARGE
jgi:hypothetical protein